MSEIHLKHRIATAKSVARDVPVTTLTGFAVESSASVTIKSEGVPLYDDLGHFVGVASPTDMIVTCPHCGGNFPIKMHTTPRYCAWCGEELLTSDAKECLAEVLNIRPFMFWEEEMVIQDHKNFLRMCEED